MSVARLHEATPIPGRGLRIRLAAPLLMMAWLFMIAPAAAAEMEVTEICRREHPTDRAMQEECVERQIEALDKINEFMTRHSLDSDNYMQRYDRKDPAASVFVYCLLEWPDSPLMQAHCLEREWATEKRYDKIR